MDQLIAVAVHLSALNQRDQSTDEHREYAEFVDPQNGDGLSAPFGNPLATEPEQLEWIDAEEASDESRRAFHTTAVAG